jgi:radical SAM superfamily enzyme YgiQ (UPF0313 family)
MSYQGIRFLYHRLARTAGVGVEFACTPWPDMERLLRDSGETLRSLQTATPAREFDLIGVSMTYELNYTNMLTVLDLAGIPLEARERGADDPLVVAGGPCCSNPLPFLDACDAVFLGDGEESLTEAVGALRLGAREGADRASLRKMLAGIDGVYVDGVTPSAAARSYDLRGDDLSPPPILPAAEIVHDRLSVEIQRGCTRGCRYCHAGMINRPRRERAIEDIVEAVRTGIDATGWDEVSLLSLSTSDYSGLGGLLERLTPELVARRVSLALPSLRPETITAPIVAASSLVRRSGFTLAPEAGTERLRRVVNRGMSNDEILDGCVRIFEGGWQRLKLYFMIGLPTETDDDVAGIVDLVGSILSLPRKRGRFALNVAVSPFVPKPNTPFQWERQCPIDELREKESYLGRRLRGRRIQLGLRDPATSLLEGVMARGDRRLWPVLVRAHRLGCRFDGWRDMLRYDLWVRSFDEHGLSPADFTGGFAVGDPLPWDRFETGISTRYLRRERGRAYAGELTVDCRDGDCTGCGACDGTSAGESSVAADGGSGAGDGLSAGDAENARSGGSTAGTSVGTTAAGGQSDGPPPEDDEGAVYRHRFIYQRSGRARFLSHLGVLRIIQRALRRTGWPLRFSRGYHPHPRLSMGPSLPVGAEGAGEFFDVELRSPGGCDPREINPYLPDGIVVLDHAGPFTRRASKLPQRARFTFRLCFDAVERVLEVRRPAAAGDERMTAWSRLGAALVGEAVCRELAERYLPGVAGKIADEWNRMIRDDESVIDRKGRSRRYGTCTVRPPEGDGGLEIDVAAGAEGYLSPRDLLRAVFPDRLIPLVEMKRLEILYETEDSYASPLALVRRAMRNRP